MNNIQNDTKYFTFSVGRGNNKINVTVPVNRPDTLDNLNNYLDTISKKNLILIMKKWNIPFAYNDKPDIIRKKLIDSFGSINSSVDIDTATSSIVDIEQISSSEDLKELIHSIHNFLRNNGIGYGMDALKIFNLIYGLKKIEKYDLYDTVNLDHKCKYSDLVTKIRNNEYIYTLFTDEYLNYVHSSNIQPFLMTELPTHIRENDLHHLILEIDRLVESEYSIGEQLSGKIYEYFIGRDASAISELGAYFTNRWITNYIYDTTKPQLKNGDVQSMIDPFGGSGGFTAGYIQYLKQYDIDWKTNINQIYHYDMNNHVVKYAGFEFMCLTRELFEDIKNNLRCENSFSHEFSKQFDYIFTNPPYGGDKNKKYGKYNNNLVLLNHLKLCMSKLSPNEIELRKKYTQQINKCIAIKKYYKNKFEASKVSVENSSQFIQRYAHEWKLNGNDKESTSLILIMALLAPGGTAVGVLKEGVFFNDTYQNLRSHLITHFNVKNVISVPQDQFENTTTKTSIIIFEKPDTKEYKIPQTQQIEFKEFNVLKHTENKFSESNGIISLDAVKNEPYGVSDKIITTVSFEELKNNNWILDMKKYNIKKTLAVDGFKLVKLGNIAKFSSKNRISEKEIIKLVKIGNISNNKIMSYSDIKSKDCKESQICQDGDILISPVRPKSGKVILIRNMININEYAFRNLKKIIINDKITYPPIYIFAMLEILIVDMEERLCNGSSYPSFNTEALKQVKIPIPTDPTIIQYWTNKLIETYDSDTSGKYDKFRTVLKSLKLASMR